MGRIFFRRAKVIDGRNQPRKNVTVVVEDKRIKVVATNGDAPKPSANDVVYDLAGRSLMPGLVQCHCHGEPGIGYTRLANELANGATSGLQDLIFARESF